MAVAGFNVLLSEVSLESFLEDLLFLEVFFGAIAGRNEKKGG